MDPDLATDTSEPAAPAAAPPRATDVLVDGWFVDWLTNQGLGVDLYNRLFAAKEDLKARLAGKE